MGQSRIYLLLGENNGKGEAKKTKGSWGKLHLIPNNKSEDFTIHTPPASGGTPATGTKMESGCLIPVSNMAHSLSRAGGGWGPVNEVPKVAFNQVSVTISQWAMVRLSDLSKNIYGKEGETSKKINFKLIFTRSVAERGRQVTHHWLTFSGTNGQIEVMSDSCDSDVHLVLSAEIWRWQNFESAGAALRDVFAATWAPDGEAIGKGQLC